MMRISIISVTFAKREISFEFSTFGGLLFSGASLRSGFDNTFHIFSPLSRVRYFRELSRDRYFRTFTAYFLILLESKNIFSWYNNAVCQVKVKLYSIWHRFILYFYHTAYTRLNDPTREIADFVIQYGHTQCFL